MPTSLSETLLHDLRVVETRSTLIELGEGGEAEFSAWRRPVVHLLLAGEAQLVLPRTGSLRPLHPGDAVLLLYGDPHRLRAGPPGPTKRAPIPEWPEGGDEPARVAIGRPPTRAVVLSAALGLAYLSPSAFASRAAPECWVLSAADGPKLLPDPAAVRQASSGPGSAAFATALASLLLVQMIRAMREEIWQRRDVDIVSPATRRVATAIREIQAHLDREWTVALLAHEVGLSRTAFAEAFRAATGATPLAFVTELRMRRAARLLTVERMSSREVAERVGYRLEGSFARAFKKHHGVSPQCFARRRAPEP